MDENVTFCLSAAWQLPVTMCNFNSVDKQSKKERDHHKVKPQKISRKSQPKNESTNEEEFMFQGCVNTTDTLWSKKTNRPNMDCPMSLKGIGIQLLNVDHLEHRAPKTHKQMQD